MAGTGHHTRNTAWPTSAGLVPFISLATQVAVKSISSCCLENQPASDRDLAFHSEQLQKEKPALTGREYWL